MAPLATGGHYVNFMAAEDPDPAATGARPVHGTCAGQRLAALKRRYAPGNVLRLNHTSHR